MGNRHNRGALTLTLSLRESGNRNRKGNTIMKMVIAIIRPERLSVVRTALEAIGIVSMTISEVRGRGAQKGVVQEFRGQQVQVDYLPKIKIEIVINTTPLDDVIDAILDNAGSGNIGDGKIFVLDVEDAVRVRTRERGPAAV